MGILIKNGTPPACGSREEAPFKWYVSIRDNFMEEMGERTGTAEGGR